MTLSNRSSNEKQISMIRSIKGRLLRGSKERARIKGMDEWTGAKKSERRKEGIPGCRHRIWNQARAREDKQGLWLYDMKGSLMADPSNCSDDDMKWRTTNTQKSVCFIHWTKGMCIACHLTQIATVCILLSSDNLLAVHTFCHAKLLQPWSRIGKPAVAN